MALLHSVSVPFIMVTCQRQSARVCYYVQYSVQK